MNKLKNPSTFVFGLVFGTLVGLLVWYWYKSTSAEDGALDLLDRMADADSHIRNLEAKLKEEIVENYITLEPNGGNLPPFLTAEKASTEKTTETVEDLTQVKGIGPVFADKLQAANIKTLAGLTAVSPQELAEILGISEKRAENILTEANRIQ
jgi:predicted flap endonuclease-1-like 5' DNA nuclease